MNLCFFFTNYSVTTAFICIILCLFINLMHNFINLLYIHFDILAHARVINNEKRRYLNTAFNNNFVLRYFIINLFFKIFLPSLQITGTFAPFAVNFKTPSAYFAKMRLPLYKKFNSTDFQKGIREGST